MTPSSMSPGSPRQATRLHAPIAQYLTPDGLGTPAQIDAILDYSAAPVDFLIAPPAGEVWRMQRVFPLLSAASFPRSDYYGAALLTNGITCQYGDNSGVICDMTGGVPVTFLAGWNGLCFDEGSPASLGVGADFKVYRWSWFIDDGEPPQLVGDDGGYISFTMRDDLRTVTSGLTRHRFFTKGYVEKVG